MAVIERLELKDDPRFCSRDARVKNYSELCDVLSTVFIQLPRAEWETRLREADVPYAPILDFFEVENDPQIVHLRTFHTADHPVLGSVRGVQAPVWCGRQRQEPNFAPPLLGEHTDEQARLAGYTEQQIAELRSAKAI